MREGLNAVWNWVFDFKNITPKKTYGILPLLVVGTGSVLKGYLTYLTLSMTSPVGQALEMQTS